jgi:hypothetical protein
MPDWGERLRCSHCGQPQRRYGGERSVAVNWPGDDDSSMVHTHTNVAAEPIEARNMKTELAVAIVAAVGLSLPAQADVFTFLFGSGLTGDHTAYDYLLRCCRPDACSVLHLGSCASPKHSLSTAHSNPISRSSTHNYEILVP